MIETIIIFILGAAFGIVLVAAGAYIFARKKLRGFDGFTFPERSASEPPRHLVDDIEDDFKIGGTDD